ncbi:hypothetical protein TWF751_012117 [Orbilia oligospora]|nr:hypothetical protein TWF751_012117 [Orbilia oligospora]KAF3258545.1 hypothetical protein TWF128_012088 [Orbilia oligospora]
MKGKERGEGWKRGKKYNIDTGLERGREGEFPTSSLGLKMARWSAVREAHVSPLLSPVSCVFARNPYTVQRSVDRAYTKSLPLRHTIGVFESLIIEITKEEGDREGGDFKSVVCSVRLAAWVWILTAI